MKKGVTGLLFVLIFTILLPVGKEKVYGSEWDNAYTYYQKYQNEVVFKATSETDGNIYFGTKAARASTKIRYRTIGWKVRILSNSGKTIQNLYFKLGGSYLYKTNTTVRSGNEYNLYVLSLSNLKRRLSREALDEMTKCNVKIFLDACMIVVKNGRELGAMNDNGPVSGKVYTTYSGISGAAGWGTSARQSFYNYFDKSVKGLFFHIKVSGKTGIASVAGGGDYCFGTCAVLNATVQTGYLFQQWTGPSRSAFPNMTVCVNRDMNWVAEAKPKELTIVFHRSLSAGDATTTTQKVVYGEKNQKFKDTGWNTKKDQLGWSLSAAGEKQDYSIYENVADSWINEHSPKVNLYAVWKTEKLETPKAPDSPAPANPKPQPKEPEESENSDIQEPLGDQKDTKIHCRFISPKYFENEGGALVPSSKGGLSEESRWAKDQNLRELLRLALSQ